MNQDSGYTWRAATRAEWGELIQGAGARASAYQTLAWQDLLEEGGMTMARLGVSAVNQPDVILGGYSGWQRGWGPTRRLAMPLMTPYLGWVVPSDSPLAGQAHQMKKLVGAIGHKVDGIASPPGYPLIEDRGDSVWERRTCILDLEGGSEGIRRRMKAHARRHLRKVESDPHWTIREISPVELDWVRAYELFGEVWKRRGLRCPVGRRLFASIWDGKCPEGFRRIWVGLHSGEVRALVLTIEHAGTLNYCIAACAAEWLKSGIATALVIRTAEDGAARGLMRYDLVGANTPSITEFKLGMGARIESYPVDTVLTGPAGLLLQAWRNRPWRNSS